MALWDWLAAQNRGRAGQRQQPLRCRGVDQRCLSRSAGRAGGALLPGTTRRSPCGRRRGHARIVTRRSAASPIIARRVPRLSGSWPMPAPSARRCCWGLPRAQAAGGRPARRGPCRDLALRDRAANARRPGGDRRGLSLPSQERGFAPGSATDEILDRAQVRVNAEAFARLDAQRRARAPLRRCLPASIPRSAGSWRPRKRGYSASAHEEALKGRAPAALTARTAR